MQTWLKLLIRLIKHSSCRYAMNHPYTHDAKRPPLTLLRTPPSQLVAFESPLLCMLSIHPLGYWVPRSAERGTLQLSYRHNQLQRVEREMLLILIGTAAAPALRSKWARHPC